MKTVARSLFAMGAVFYLSLLSRLSPEAPAVPEKPAEAIVEVAAPVVFDNFGVKASAYHVTEDRIQQRQTFSQVLSAYHIDPATIRRLAEEAEPVFDVRQLRAGSPLRVYWDKTRQAVQMFVYQTDPVHYLVFDLRGGARVYSRQHPVQTVQRTLRGVITGSPYESFVEQGLDVSLAVELSEIFAWQIDFYHIRRGDRFTILFKEQQLDGRPVGQAEILAVRFNHAGRDYYAFGFGEGEEKRYYDEKGNSLRQAFLKAPIEYSRISSSYAKERFHPILKKLQPHLGTDYAAPEGTPIRATGDGVVLAAGFAEYNGNYVKLQHNNTYMTGYLHMSIVAPGIRPGVRIEQGQVIGYVGATGLATGPHLCYRFWKDGVQVDPYEEEELMVTVPITGDQREAFEEQRDELVLQLADEPRPPLQFVSASPLLDELKLSARTIVQRS